jgi:hypothetical protein
MFYDFTLTNGDDRASIMPVRCYHGPALNEKTISNINTILAQALAATDLAVGEMANTTLDFSPSWVESTDDETTLMLLAESWFIPETGEIKSHGARYIAEQILKDLASTDDWEFLFEGTAESFDCFDFMEFSFIDHRINNDNLKVAIGSEVYVRGHQEETFIYQGRPENSDISYGRNPLFADNKKEVLATDDQIIPVEGFPLAEYTARIETFPLPQTVSIYGENFFGKNKYFSREKNPAGKVTLEALGKTQKEAKLRLALLMAFAEIEDMTSVERYQR